jgi:glycosyltransferase involved in cell wall biosynthesis
VKNKRVLIITECKCNPPIGPGARRVRCFAKALHNAAWDVQVVYMVLRSRPQKEVKFLDEGITYRYLACYFPGIGANNPFANIFRILNFIVFSFRLVIKLFLIKNGLVITYSKYWPAIWMFGLLLKKTKIPFVHEISEWPPEIPEIKHNLKHFYAKRLFRLIDGAIVISDFIEQKVVLWNKENPSHCVQSLKIPILFETDSPSGNDLKSCNEHSTSFFWCGDLEGYISLVRFILDALSIACKKDNKSYSLSLCGKAPESIRIDLLSYANKIHLSQDQIIFLGFLSDDDLTREMSNSCALLAPLHNDKRSMARFPTKIAEYLITGKPVIATGVGEIPKYLNDAVNAFVAKPDDLQDFTDKMRLIIRDPQLAYRVGRIGRETALKYFYFANYSEALDRFCSKLIWDMQVKMDTN